MPQLEGTGYRSSSTIRMFYARQVSRFDLIKTPDIMRYIVKLGVAEICSKCVKAGYYIVGLEQARLEENPSTPYEIRNYSPPYSTVMVSLDLRVRRFSDKLTTDELYFYSERFSERILFEMTQLENESIRSAPVLDNSIVNIGVDSPEVNDAVGRFINDTSNAPKPKPYKVIRHTREDYRCSSTHS